MKMSISDKVFSRKSLEELADLYGVIIRDENRWHSHAKFLHNEKMINIIMSVFFLLFFAIIIILAIAFKQCYEHSIIESFANTTFIIN